MSVCENYSKISIRKRWKWKILSVQFFRLVSAAVTSYEAANIKRKEIPLFGSCCWACVCSFVPTQSSFIFATNKKLYFANYLIFKGKLFSINWRSWRTMSKKQCNFWQKLKKNWPQPKAFLVHYSGKSYIFIRLFVVLLFFFIIWCEQCVSSYLVASVDGCNNLTFYFQI